MNRIKESNLTLKEFTIFSYESDKDNFDNQPGETDLIAIANFCRGNVYHKEINIKKRHIFLGLNVFWFVRSDNLSNFAFSPALKENEHFLPNNKYSFADELGARIIYPAMILNSFDVGIDHFLSFNHEDMIKYISTKDFREPKNYNFSFSAFGLEMPDVDFMKIPMYISLFWLEDDEY